MNYQILSLIITYSIVLMIAASASFVRNYFAGGTATNPLGNAMAIVTLIAQIVAISVQFLVWVMPEFFRKWLNRNQQAHAEEKIHEQVMVILDILGSAMSDSTGLTKMGALFAIRKIIGQEIKTEDSAKVETHMLTLGYNGWLELLNDPELYIALGSAGAKNPRDAFDNAKRALVEKQSLFTMQAK